MAKPLSIPPPDDEEDSSPLRRRERNKQRTRRAILKAAHICFSRDGIAAARMEDIAETADVARGTLFNYFPSKAELVSELVREQRLRWRKIVQTASESGAGVEKRIHYIFEESARAIRAHAAVTRGLLDPAQPGWAVAASGAQASFDLVEALAAALRTAPDAAAAIRKDVAIDELGEILLSLFAGVAHLWRLDANYPLEQRCAQAANLACELVRGR